MEIHSSYQLEILYINSPALGKILELAVDNGKFPLASRCSNNAVEKDRHQLSSFTHPLGSGIE